MTILQSFLLGILQGIAEFLPISSSGHLALVEHLFKIDEIPLLFDVFLHLSTLLAVILVLRKQIWQLLCVFGRWITKKGTEQDKPFQTMILAIIVGTVITGILGIVSSKLIPTLPIYFVFIGFIITAFLLIFSSRFTPKTVTNDTVSVKQGFFIGLAQGIGTLPGISRSGITMSASLLSGVDRKTTGEFSFILSIPAILGAFLLELKDLDEMTGMISPIAIIIGCIAAFVVGFFALKFLLNLVKKGKLEYFAWYLIPLAIICLIFIR